MSVPVTVVRTGVANMASVLAGLRRAGAEPTLSVDAEEIAAAERVMLPGVGAFGAAMTVLREHGLHDVIAARVREGRPLLAVCLGLQLLCRESEETPGVAGLGVIDAAVTRFGDDLVVPQLGWNEVVPQVEGGLIARGYAYFANSFKLAALPASAEGWSVALTDHGGPFVSAMQRGPVLACQFHPELSGAWGQALLRRWVHGEASAC